MTGALNVVTPPTLATHAASKAYVDAASVAAAPFADAMAYSGMQINGGFDVSQELGSVGRTTPGYVCDGWIFTYSGTMAPNCIVDKLVPTNGYVGRLYTYATVAQPSLGANDNQMIFQNIEGYRIARLAWGSANAKPITISFWSQHQVSGTYSISLRNKAVDRSYIATYTQNAASTLEYKTITIPGCTDGTWKVDNDIGIYLGFAAAAGSNLIAPSANTWLNGGYLAASGQANIASAISQTFVLRGVVVLPGIYAPTAAQSPLIMRPYDQELVTCQRYWWCSNPASPKGSSLGALSGYGLIANAISIGNWKPTVIMRAAPTMTLWSVGVQNNVRNNSNGAVISGVGPIATSYFYQGGGCTLGVTSFASGNWIDFDLQADARL